MFRTELAASRCGWRGVRAYAAALLIAGVLLAAAGKASAQVWVFTDERGNLHFSDTRQHMGYRPFDAAPKLSTEDRQKAAKQSSVRYDALIALASQTHQLSPALVKAVIHAESRFHAKAVSRAGARGLMQLMPATADELGVDDPFDAWQNIEGGTRYLGQLVRRFEGDIHLALAAYHAGATTVQRYGGVPPYRETRRYVKRVLTLYRRYDADFR
jgi:soluble lytic murein transglycosylase-like protein